MFTSTLFLLAVTTVVPSSVSLRGKVQDESGAPIAGAVVDIYAAKPKVGAAITCPSCYRDCAKSATTSSDGTFSIPELDSGLLFKVLVMAPGRRAHLTSAIDPDTTSVDVRLDPLPKDLPVDRMLKGRVLDNRGEPLAGAVVTPAGAKTNERRWWGSTSGVDEAAITDASGRFIITSQDPKLAIDLKISAAGFADFPRHLFDLDGSEHEIRLSLGASVLGKLTFEGQPVANRSIGIVQTDRSPQTFVGERAGMTDSAGRFQFTDLQPNQEYCLYSLCEPNVTSTVKGQPADRQPVLKTQTVTTSDSGKIDTLGELKMAPGVKLVGRVTFPDGTPATTEVKVRLSRDPAWDWCETTVSGNGAFVFPDLPTEAYTVSVNAKGFEIDPAQFRFQLIEPSEFGVRLRSEGKSEVSIMVPLRSVKP